MEHLGTQSLGLLGYVVVTYLIAYAARTYLRKKYRLLSTRETQKNMDVSEHYLARKSITSWELFFFTIATEFSGLGFISIPAMVYSANFSAFRFLVGAMISRVLIALFFLPLVVRKGTTILEVFGRGIRNYEILNLVGRRAQCVAGVFYISAKVVGMGANLFGASIVLSGLLKLPLGFVIVSVALITYGYVVIGGLKGIVWTSYLQVPLFILGGVAAHWVIADLSNASWLELFQYGIAHDKLSIVPNLSASSAYTGTFQIDSFLIGIFAGLLHDAASHGVDQEHTQVLLGSKSLRSAQRAMLWSIGGTFFVQMLFVLLGVVAWSFVQIQSVHIVNHGQAILELIETRFPPEAHFIIAVGILSAAMSTLDSSINALGTCLWNDVFNARGKLVRVYIHLDNLIITLCVLVVATLLMGGFEKKENFTQLVVLLSYLSGAPALVYFLCRLVLFRQIAIGFSPYLVVLITIITIFAMFVAYIRLELDAATTLLFGVFTSILFMWIHARLSRISLRKEVYS